MDGGKSMVGGNGYDTGLFSGKGTAIVYAEKRIQV
jgi:hypothetical protein